LKLNITSQNPACMIPRIFNSLPIGIKCMQRDNEFMCKIRECALKYQFYDLNEFFICDFFCLIKCLLTYFKTCNVNNWLYKIKIYFGFEFWILKLQIKLKCGGNKGEKIKWDYIINLVFQIYWIFPPTIFSIEVS
jgi:hypothetical protein